MKTEGRVLAAYGAGGYGREILELAELINQSDYSWSGFVFIDDDGDLPAVIDGKRVLSFESALREFGDKLDAVICVGEPRVRELLYERIKAVGVNLPTLINPCSYVSPNASIGEGTVIRYGSSVFTGAVIGENVCINPHANIGHDSVIEEGCMISNFADIAGAVHVGKYSYIGMNSCIKELTVIGKRSVVGMGSVIVKDVPDLTLAVGNPSRLVEIDDNYRVFGKP